MVFIELCRTKKTTGKCKQPLMWTACMYSQSKTFFQISKHALPKDLKYKGHFV